MLLVVWPFADISLGGDHYMYLARSFARGSLDVDAMSDRYRDYILWNGHKYLPFGPLPAILLIPLAAIASGPAVIVFAGYAASHLDALKAEIEAVPPAHRITSAPRIGHKLHRLTTMTSKTPQFHLLANGNPKPENLLVSPLVQINADGTPREQAVAVGVSDRSNPSGR